MARVEGNHWNRRISCAILEVLNDRVPVSTEEHGERREILYRGRVQGVGFRYTTQRIASRLTVTGYVKNLPDGRVLLIAEGQPEELDGFLAAVREELGRYIVDVGQLVGPATGQYCRFDVRF
jgi:acylphosphatase